MIIVFVCSFLLFKGLHACSCEGIELELSDQKHCFQIIRNTGNSWVSSDEKCSSMGGFLAHINTTTLYNELYDYVSQNYQLPLMTGATVANVELGLVAFMCPSNTFYSLLSSSFVSSFFEGSPTTTDRCTFIMNNVTPKLQYLPCDSEADILCDRPMENTNYCNIKMNCTETTLTSFLSSTTTSLFETTPKVSVTSTVKESTTVQPNSTTQPVTQSTTSRLILTTPPLNPTTALNNSLTTTIKPSQTVPNAATTTSAVIISTLSNPTSLWELTTTPSPSSSCGSGYTRVFGWCVPWWCWLVFGLLLLGLLLCCLSWCCHFCCAGCLCSHKKESPVETIVEKQWQREDAICQTDPFIIPPNHTVYIPVPKTPPPEVGKPPEIIREREPTNTHTIMHTHEIIREKTLPSVLPQPSVIYDVTVYENAFNTNTMLVPPIVQHAQPSPNLFFPSTQSRILEDDIISANSIPISAGNSLTPSPTPLYTKDEADYVPIVPIAAMPTTMPVLPLKPPTKKSRKERQIFSPLKHNRPPIGSLPDDQPEPKKQLRDDERDFPKPPPRIIETPPERDFPQPPPKTRNISPPKSLETTFDHPLRKNTPLNFSEQPERLSRTPKQQERPPLMPRLPTRLPFEVASPDNEVKPARKRAKSPPVTIFEPRTSPPSALKPSNKRRISPMNDEPPRMPTSPRKFRTPSPNDISGKSMAASSSMPPSRRRHSLENQETETPNKNDVSMLAPRGRLGGADDKPEGWKPWAKSSQLFSGHPGFLDD